MMQPVGSAQSNGAFERSGGPAERSGGPAERSGEVTFIDPGQPLIATVKWLDVPEHGQKPPIDDPPQIVRLRRYPAGEVIAEQSLTAPNSSAGVTVRFDPPGHGGVYQCDVLSADPEHSRRWWTGFGANQPRVRGQHTFVVGGTEMPSIEPEIQAPTGEGSHQPIAVSLDQRSSPIVDALQTIGRPLGGLAIGSDVCHLLESVETPRGTMYRLPPATTYQCDLPAIETERCRVHLDLDPNRQADLSVEWFDDADGDPIWKHDIQWPQTLDNLTEPTRMSFVIDGFRPTAVAVVNRSPDQSARLAGLSIESIPQSTKDSATAGPGSTHDHRQHDLWVRTIPWPTPVGSSSVGDVAGGTDEGDTDVAPGGRARSTSGAAADWSATTRAMNQVRQTVRCLEQLRRDVSADRLWLTADAGSKPWRTTIDAVSPNIRWVQMAGSSTPGDRRTLPDTGTMVPRRDVEIVSLPVRRAELITTATTESFGQTADGDNEPLTLVLSNSTSDSGSAVSCTVIRPWQNSLPPINGLSASNLVSMVSASQCLVQSAAGPAAVRIETPTTDAWIKVWRSLPAGPSIDSAGDEVASVGEMTDRVFQPIDSVDPENQTVTVLADRSGGWVLCNHSPWRTVVRLKFQRRWEGSIQLTGSADLQQQRPGHCHLELPPRGIAYCRGENASLQSWSAVIAGGVDSIDNIKSAVTAVVERVGWLHRPTHQSDVASFRWVSPIQTDSPAPGTSLSPWLHTQHPPGCVRRIADPTPGATLIPHDGHPGCVEMRCTPEQKGRTWMVSPTFDVGQTGRLAVSMQCRVPPTELTTASNSSTVSTTHRDNNNVALASAEVADGTADPSVRLRVSLEAIELGKPIRLQQTIHVAPDDQWQDFDLVLQTHRWDRSETESLRVAIDLLGPGVVQVRDLRVHDRFVSRPQQERLQNLAFLAVQGFRKGNLTHSSRLLSRSDTAALLRSWQKQPVTPVVAVDHQRPSGPASRTIGTMLRPVRRLGLDHRTGDNAATVKHQDNPANAAANQTLLRDASAHFQRPVQRPVQPQQTSGKPLAIKPELSPSDPNRSATESTETERSAETPSVTSRLRSWWPRALRF